MPTQAERYEDHRDKLAGFAQSHLLAFWDRLSDPQRDRLLDDLDQIDLERCAALVDSHVRSRPVVHIPEHIEPPASLPEQPRADQAGMYADARAAGAAAIRDGRVATFTVAGGQGTRLGFDGPKGAFCVSPIRNVTLFQVFAEGLLGVRRRYGRRLRWYIMTSPTNHEETGAFFDQHEFFGLDPDDVMFFRQGQMPTFLPDGRIALAERHRIALSPDGHGGSLRALARSGALEDMRKHGIDVISYYQVDNPLTKAVDPLFIGLHLLTGSEMSSKAMHKAHDTEPVGNFCLVDGKVGVIEYSDLPEDLARSKNPDGTRRFDAGNVAIHVLSRAFAERLTAPGATVHLPWHRADKKVPTVDAGGNPVTPDAPNAVKLERFIFDALPLADNPLVLFTSRGEEFSPVKNSDGNDSPATSRRDQIRRAADWLESCGVAVPRGAGGEPAVPIEISNRFALDADDLREQLEELPKLAPGNPLLLA